MYEIFLEEIMEFCQTSLFSFQIGFVLKGNKTDFLNFDVTR